MNINRIIALCALVLLPAAGMAQNEKRGFANIDWQFNIPLSNGFSDKASGWGMNIEGGYYFENNIGIGLFFAYHTNNEYIGMRTLQLSESSSLRPTSSTRFTNCLSGQAFATASCPTNYLSPT